MGLGRLEPCKSREHVLCLKWDIAFMTPSTALSPLAHDVSHSTTALTRLLAILAFLLILARNEPLIFLLSMATSASDSDSDYGYDFTAEEEELLADIVDGLSRSLQGPPVPPAPAVAPPSTSAPNNSPPPSVLAALQGLTEDDLAFDIGELEPDFAPTHYIAQRPPDIARDDVAGPSKRSLSPSIAGDHEVGLASYVSEVKAHHIPTVVSPTDVRYPDSEFVPTPCCYKCSN